MSTPATEGSDVAPTGWSHLQQQVQEVAKEVHVNVVKLMDREHKLSELDAVAKGLEDESKLFKESTGKIRKKYWWKNVKATLVLAAVVILVVVVLLVWGLSTI